ncbi:MAG: hypothetical protein ACO3A2_07900 [Bdellovibrionia bacterium]
MANQKKATRSTSGRTGLKKNAKPASARKRASLKAAAPSRRKRDLRAPALAKAPLAQSRSSASLGSKSVTRGEGAIKRAIKKGISELAKVGS